jgi:hypothetical protein
MIELLSDLRELGLRASGEVTAAESHSDDV